MKQPNKVVIREFECPECGERILAPKHKRSEKEHIKTMWCWKCKAERDFELIGQEVIKVL